MHRSAPRLLILQVLRSWLSVGNCRRVEKGGRFETEAAVSDEASE